jgi:hypothetical protein
VDAITAELWRDVVGDAVSAFNTASGGGAAGGQ